MRSCPFREFGRIFRLPLPQQGEGEGAHFVNIRWVRRPSWGSQVTDKKTCYRLSVFIILFVNISFFSLKWKGKDIARIKGLQKTYKMFSLYYFDFPLIQIFLWENHFFFCLSVNYLNIMMDFLNIFLNFHFFIFRCLLT